MEDRKTKSILIMVMCIFGTVGIFVNYIKLPTSLIAVVRGSLGATFLFAMIKFRKEKISFESIKVNWKILFFSGTLIGLNWIFLFEAYKYTTVAIATLCSYLAPVFMMLASHFILKEKLNKINIICISIALLGMFFVSGVLESKEFTAGNFRGILFGLMTAVCYAFAVFINKSVKGVKPNDMTIVQLAVAALILLPYILISKTVSNIEFDLRSVIFLLIISILHTGFSYAVYFDCVSKLKTQTVAIYSYLDPIVAIVFSAIILKQRMNFLSIIGAVLILGSTLFSELMEKKKKI